MKPYPIFLTGLHNRHCIVIGGTHEAEGKVRSLLAVDATITVISPQLNETLTDWANEGCFTWLKRPFQSGDLRGAFLVIAERSDPDTNTMIWEEAEAEGILVNVMDDVDHCNFVAGSVVRQGPLILSISTSGAAPALSVRLRQRFEAEFSEEYAVFLEWMKALRPHMAATYSSFQERKRRYYALVDSDVLLMIKNGRLSEAQACVEEISGIQLFSTESIHH